MSQMDAKEISVGDSKYKVYMLDPLDSADLFLDLMAAIGPALAPMAEGVVGNKDLMNAAKEDKLKEFLGTEDEEANGWAGSLERGAMSFFKNFDKAFQRRIFTEMAKISRYVNDGKELPVKDIMSIHFKGKVFEMYEWAFRCLIVQYSDFFERASPVISAAINKSGLAESLSQGT